MIFVAAAAAVGLIWIALAVCTVLVCKMARCGVYNLYNGPMIHRNPDSMNYLICLIDCHGPPSTRCTVNFDWFACVNVNRAKIYDYCGLAMHNRALQLQLLANMIVDSWQNLKNEQKIQNVLIGSHYEKHINIFSNCQRTTYRLSMRREFW